jgi:hypothetical protein
MVKKSTTTETKETINIQIYKLRPLFEKEYGSSKDATRLMEGLITDITKEGFGYARHQLRAMSFLSKDQEFKAAIDSLIEKNN